jgi:hypothetical protein
MVNTLMLLGLRESLPILKTGVDRLNWAGYNLGTLNRECAVQAMGSVEDGIP